MLLTHIIPSWCQNDSVGLHLGQFFDLHAYPLKNLDIVNPRSTLCSSATHYESAMCSLLSSSVRPDRSVPTSVGSSVRPCPSVHLRWLLTPALTCFTHKCRDSGVRGQRTMPSWFGISGIQGNTVRREPVRDEIWEPYPRL